MATKKPKPVEADPPLPEDYYDSFHGRGQDELDQMALDQGLLPSETDQSDEEEDIEDE